MAAQICYKTRKNESMMLKLHELKSNLWINHFPSMTGPFLNLKTFSRYTPEYRFLNKVFDAE